LARRCLLVDLCRAGDFYFNDGDRFFYFAYVHRHVGAEINTLANDMGSMVGIALRQYWAALIGFILICWWLAMLWHKLFSAIPSAPRSPWLRLGLLPLLMLLMLVVGRGGVSGKPISVGEAFFPIFQRKAIWR